MDLREYPNLQAIIDGRISGQITEWPAIMAELIKLVEQLEDLDHLFELWSKRVQQVTKSWQEASGRHDVLPDLGQMLEWAISREGRIKELEDAMRLINALLGEIVTSRLGSIGALYNVYCPQLSRQGVDFLYRKIRTVLEK